MNNQNVDNEIQVDGQMSINQTAQACIISQLMLEESPQVGKLKKLYFPLDFIQINIAT